MDDGHRLAELPVSGADLGDRGGYGVRFRGVVSAELAEVQEPHLVAPMAPRQLARPGSW
jgi:hypothetical protein